MSPLSPVDAGLYQQITKPEQVRHLFELGKDGRIHCDSKEDLLSNKKPYALSLPFLYSHLKSVPLQELTIQKSLLLDATKSYNSLLASPLSPCWLSL